MGAEPQDPYLYSGSRRRVRDPRRREKARRGEIRIRDPMQHRFGGQWHFTPVVRQISLFFRYYKGYISMDARERRFRLIADKVHAARIKWAKKVERRAEDEKPKLPPLPPFIFIADHPFKLTDETSLRPFSQKYKPAPEQILKNPRDSPIGEVRQTLSKRL